MRETAPWLMVGAGGAFLLAAVISVAMGGPSWPFYLVLGGLCLVAAMALGLRPIKQGPDETE